MQSQKEDTVDAIVATILVQSVFNPELVQTTFKERKEKYEHPKPTDNPFLTPPREWDIAADCVQPYYEAMLQMRTRALERIALRDLELDPKDISGDRMFRKLELRLKTLFYLVIWIVVPLVTLHFVIKYW